MEATATGVRLCGALLVVSLFAFAITQTGGAATHRPIVRPADDAHIAKKALPSSTGGRTPSTASAPRTTHALPGTRYYVDAAAGDDSAAGTSSMAPWRTLARANGTVQAGDTVVLTGTFRNQAIFPRQSGTAGAPITYVASARGAATISGPGQLYPANPNLTAELFVVAASYVVVDGISFAYDDYVDNPLTENGVRILDSDHVTIRNCSLDHVPLAIEHSSYDDIEHNVLRDYVGSYVNPQTNKPDPSYPWTIGNLLWIRQGSSYNTIRFDDLKYGGHSLIAVGSGWDATSNAANIISDNQLSNPWYEVMQLADDGQGTVVERNTISDSATEPTLHATACCNQGQVVASSGGIEVSGSNYIIRNNILTNNVSYTGVIHLGGYWHSDSNHPTPALVEAQNNQIYENKITNNRGPAAIAFVVWYTRADRDAQRAQPLLTGNTVSNNVVSGNSGSAAGYWDDGTFADLLYFADSYVPPFPGNFGGNSVRGNAFQTTTGGALPVMVAVMSNGHDWQKSWRAVEQFSR